MTEKNGGFSSQITFLNFADYAAGKAFLSEVLGLSRVYDIGWAAVYAVSPRAFLGAVDKNSGRVMDPRRNTLVSLTTDSIEAWHQRIRKSISNVTPIRELPDAGLRSFFFTGPEGFLFEIQQFTLPEAQQLF